MLFEPQAETLTKQAYRMAMAHSDVARKADAAKKLDYYNNAQVSHVVADIQKKYKDPKRIDAVFLNVVRKIVNLISRVYLQDATRSIDGTEQDKAIFAEIETAANLPGKMKLADRYTKLLGTILVRPLWRDGRPDLDVLTGDVINVVVGDSPEQLLAVLITHAAESGKPGDIEYSLWTDSHIQRLSYSGQVISSEPNPYGVLPFVVVSSEPLTDSFWLEGASDLIAAQDAINARLTDIFYILHYQSHAVGYVKGAAIGNGTELISGPGSMMSLPENGSVGFVAPDAPIADSLAAIEFLMKQAAVCNGLPAGSLSSEVSRESGVSKVVSNTELEEQRRDAIAIFADVEDKLFRLWRIIWNVHNPGRKISDAATLVCDFFDPKPDLTGYEQGQTFEKLIDLNLMSRVDALIELNPDLTRESAKARLKEIMAENEEFGTSVPDYSPSFAGFGFEDDTVRG